MRSVLLVSAFLTAVLAVSAPRTLPAQGEDGRAIYLKQCRTCHGNSGAPTKQALRENPKMPTLDAALLSKLTDDSLVTVVTKGKGEGMKPFKTKLSAEEIKAVVGYVRTMVSTPKP